LCKLKSRWLELKDFAKEGDVRIFVKTHVFCDDHFKQFFSSQPPPAQSMVQALELLYALGGENIML